MQRSSFALLVIFLLASVACGGDDAPMEQDGSVPADGSMPDGSMPGPDGSGTEDGGVSSSSGRIEGLVFDADAVTPLEGVRVSVEGGSSATTDATGTFALADVPAGAGVVVQLAKDGFARTVELVQVRAGQSSYTEAFLQPVTVSGRLDAASGGRIGSDTTGAEAFFPAGALVDGSGSPVTGEVEVELTAVDPTTTTGLRAFPGAFVGQRSDGSETLIETFGPMDITLTQDGEALDLASGESAVVSFPVRSADAPQSIVLWSLDESSGTWVEEGMANRRRDDDGHEVYVATITHLSWWNPDHPLESTCVRTCVTDGGSPAAHTAVIGSGVGYAMADIGYTGEDGCVSLMARPGSRVELLAMTPTRQSEEVVVQAPDTLAPDDETECTRVADLTLQERPADDCPTGLVDCNGTCVDLTRDRINCGGCGAVCGSGSGFGPSNSVCLGGSCECGPDQVECNGRCVGVLTDPNSCGGCAPPIDTGADRSCASSDGSNCCPDLFPDYPDLCPDVGCVDLSSDNDHCGSCGNACPDGTRCESGSCEAITCSGGQNPCGHGCIDGPCGQRCAAGEMCEDGMCAPLECGDTLTVCDDRCVDTQNDDAHCGECNSPCGTGTTCMGGSCQTIECPVGTELCGDECIDTNSSDTHCGGCTARDAPGATTATMCTSSDGSNCCGDFGLDGCDQGGDEWLCVDFERDADHCGSCGNACADNQFCDYGSCTDVQCEDGQVLCEDGCVWGESCGTNCSYTNTDGQTCTSGQCVCPEGSTVCGLDIGRPECADLQTDSRNCGSCGNQCDYGLECVSGRCQPIECPGEEVYCDSGCTDPLTDDENCGGCSGVRSRGGTGNASCAGSGCCDSEFGLDGCLVSGDTYECFDFSEDNDHCGSCDNACGGAQICQSGTCEPVVCPDGQIACNHRCVNGTTCGTVCGSSQTCTDGTCG
jgi:hypothetical protein